jgi:hypothetical protein
MRGLVIALSATAAFFGVWLILPHFYGGPQLYTIGTLVSVIVGAGLFVIVRMGAKRGGASSLIASIGAAGIAVLATSHMLSAILPRM